MKSLRYPRFWKIAAPAFAALVLTMGTILTGAFNPGDYLSGGTVNKSTEPALSYSRSEFSYDEAEAAAPASAEWMAFDGDSQTVPLADEVSDENILSGRKIVRSADISLATGDFAADEEAIRRQVDAAGGYVENMYQYEFPDENRLTLRQVSFTVRVPSENYNAFLSGVSGIGRVTARNESTADMTYQYTDATLRLQTQREKMKRLLELMAVADTVTDLIEIENAVAGAQYEIDAYETSLRAIDRQADQSTVLVHLREESPAQSAVEAAVNLGDRLRHGLEASIKGIGRFFQNMLVFVVMALPVMVPLAAVCGVITLAVRRGKKANDSR